MSEAVNIRNGSIKIIKTDSHFIQVISSYQPSKEIPPNKIKSINKQIIGLRVILG
jgi:hypothetical protein